jgi:hypothetical protein
MASTMQQRPQRLGECARRVLDCAPFSVEPGDDNPTGRYDEEGNLYIDIPPCLIGSPIVATLLLVLERNFPETMTDCDGPRHETSTVWAHWQHAQRAEAIVRLFWPTLHVVSPHNPRYRQGGTLAEQLGVARRAIAATEAAVRCGVAFGGTR